MIRAKIKVETSSSLANKQAAESSATRSTEKALESESYAIGGTGTRNGENTDNAKYYSEQAKKHCENASAISGVGIASQTKAGLVKGGDVDNAIVIVEHPVTKEQVENMSRLFNIPALEVREDGYLSNLQLRFDNECARHKLLDLIGDLRLCGGFLKAKVTAEKAGHGINTTAAKAVRKSFLA